MEEIIQQLRSKQELNASQIALAADFLLSEKAPLETKARFLQALSHKGESAAEIAGFVQSFLKHSLNPEVPSTVYNGTTIDVCGTGGDKLDLFNVSTTSMFVIAASGATVMKHGNRGITSKSGGADVLEALGINLNIEPEQLQQCLQQAGVGFLFAQKYHPAFKSIAPVRAELAKQGIRTIFNLIGPLLNPAVPECQLVGVCDPQLSTMYPQILQQLGRKNAWVVNGKTADGRAVDEMSLMGETLIHSIGKKTNQWNMVPEEVGLRTCTEAELKGGDAAVNAIILENILSGKERGAKRDMVLLNAAAGMMCSGTATTLQDAVRSAAELIDSGAAIERLRTLQEIAQS